MYDQIEISFTKPYMKNYGIYTRIIRKCDLRAVKSRMEKRGFKIISYVSVGLNKGGKG